MADGFARRNDPERRQRIIAAALEVIAEHGVPGTTHRRIAAAAGVPLGSVTYYFTSLETLLTDAFTQLAEESSHAFAARMAQAQSHDDARAAIIDIIAGSVWAEPRTLLLSYELYAFAARHPSVSTVMQGWMNNSRAALERFFDPLTARALDALVEGIGIHNSIDPAPLDRNAISDIVHRITGGAG
ncbi:MULTISPECIES: TetR/AcrR family transcriptional regulator [Sphingomonas]|jgi:TetR/AcrR family transcriptional regulator, regulator of biofilm formation and stress response|uniref:TetR family transcriptional regulator n=1 Tax=Sphingomonas zeae TaxID=1646122 RepID=A0A7Y6B4B8_9SPHN|nr:MULTISPECIES: TetR family transcriptional regulator [Sphingomonas]MBB4048533.1 DNA-binding transcriptional regulator YbjK [Sphingomonas zeae]MDK8187457.1 TetR family transcriptional regulator [Sphingomonas zeae]MDK8217191.1 TetR family transcriptional regulator [Sphingomonas sp. UMB7805-LC452B]NUU46217.1 TetR family transcriptional regulator [Sphingomonas zeae]